MPGGCRTDRRTVGIYESDPSLVVNRIVLGIVRVSSAMVHECTQNCINTSGCVAYSYKSTTGECQRYGGGPYTNGDGIDEGFKCYLLPGKLTLFSTGGVYSLSLIHI